MQSLILTLGLIAVLGTLQNSVAQEPARIGIDYDLVFEMHADQVEIHSGSNNRTTQTLSLPGDIVIRRTDTEERRTTSGWDQSGAGAVGCALLIFLEARRSLDMCTNFQVSRESEAQIDAALDRIGRFYGENAIPRFDHGQFLEFLTDYREQSVSNRMECPNTGILTLVEGILAEDITDYIENLLSVPRLPVGNPCF